jgi:hypothetical protein
MSSPKEFCNYHRTEPFPASDEQFIGFWWDDISWEGYGEVAGWDG